MTWFSLWLPLLLQLVVPLLLVAAVAVAGRTAVTRLALAALTGLYVVAIALAGLWLVLPWWMPFVHGVLLLVALTTRRWRRVLSSRPATATGRRLTFALLVGGTVVLSTITILALRGQRPPADPLELSFPLHGGTYLVVNGGNHVLINAHVNTLQDARFRAYRGQSYGVDLVGLDRLGLRARGVLPADPAAYVIYGERVLAPCPGRVVAVADGAPDMPPPQPDRSHMAGNHVLLDCDGTWVLLGHLQSGSVAVQKGQAVTTGEYLGRVGNSGNTGEPHLHIHAQQPGSDAEPMSGWPVPVMLGGRYLVRNDRVR